MYEKGNTNCPTASFKLKVPVAEGQLTGSLYPQPQRDPRMISTCPVVTVTFNGQLANCLVDTGSEVTTMASHFYQHHFGNTPTQDPSWLNLKAANNLPIPVVGVTWMSIKVYGQTLNRVGVVVTRDASFSDIPVVLGMNALKELDLTRLLREASTERSKRPETQLQNLVNACRAVQTSRDKYTEKVGVVRLPACQRVTIQPRQELVCPFPIVARRHVEGATVMVEPQRNLEIKGEWLVARTLSVVQQGHVLMQLVNLGSAPLQVPTDLAIADVYTVPKSCITDPCPGVEAACASLQSALPDSEDSYFWQLVAQLALPVQKMTSEQITKIQQLVHKHMIAFSQGPEDYGCTTALEHPIHTGDTAPIRERYRNIPPALCQEVKDLLRGMLQGGVIRESRSPWAAPIVLVRKKDGNLRFCVDYRRLNSCTHRDAYPLPRVEESLMALGQAQYFSTLDLASGYWQVPVREEDREKTAFITPLGLYEFNRMPFGLTNAPSTFQRLMERCLGDLNFDSVLIYLDDIIIFSKTFEDHLKHLDQVLSRLAQYGLKLKPEKCHLMKSKINYLGHVVEAKGVSPDPDKILAVRAWTPPKTVTELRSFLGLVGYYRRFIPNFASVAAPLTQLLCGHPAHQKGKSSPSIHESWGREQSEAFETLKAKLTSAPILAYADYCKPFRVYTDGSLQGLGAVLAQEQNGTERVIAFASRSLRPTERNPANYSSFKLELLAVVWAVTEKFAEYLVGGQVDIYTDNNPLAYLETAKLGALEQRWVARLAQFNYTIHYKPGRSNGNADALSRFPHDQPQEDIDQRLEEYEVVPSRVNRREHRASSALQSDQIPQRGPEIHTPQEWIKLQWKDPDIGQLMKYWDRNRKPDYRERRRLSPTLCQLLKQWTKLERYNGLLYRKTRIPGEPRIIHQLIIPQSEALEVCQVFHCTGGHFCAERTEAFVRKYVFCPGLTKWVLKVCQECQSCATHKGKSEKTTPLVVSTGEPFELLTMDFLTVADTSGFRYALVFVDHFSKFAIVVPTKDQTAITTAKLFWKHVVQPYGCPKRILSDQGPNFESQLFSELCRLSGIRKSHTTPYHPQGNGVCERFNRTLLGLIRTLEQEQRERWPQYVGDVVWAYNQTVHRATGYTPHFLMFGRCGRLPVDLLLETPESITSRTPDEWVQDHWHRLAQAKQIVLGRHQDLADNSSVNLLPLKPGDRVLVCNPRHIRGSKLEPKWEPCPYRVEKQPFPGRPVYDVVSEKPNGLCKRLHRNLLRPCVFTADSLSAKPVPDFPPSARWDSHQEILNSDFAEWCLPPLPPVEDLSSAERATDNQASPTPVETEPLVDEASPIDSDAEEELGPDFPEGDGQLQVLEPRLPRRTTRGLKPVKYSDYVT